MPDDREGRAEEHSSFDIRQGPGFVVAPHEGADARVTIASISSVRMRGGNGLQPIHITGIARGREDNCPGAISGNFANVFHHNWLSLLYRA